MPSYSACSSLRFQVTHGLALSLLMLGAGLTLSCNASRALHGSETAPGFVPSAYWSPAHFGYPLSIREYESMDTSDSLYAPPQVRSGMRLAFGKVQYPPQAMEQAITGRVVLELYINRKGALTHIELIESAHPLLARAAVDAAQRWRYQAARLGERPVPSFFRVPLNFRMQTVETEIEGRPAM